MPPARPVGHPPAANRRPPTAAAALRRPPPIAAEPPPLQRPRLAAARGPPLTPRRRARRVAGGTATPPLWRPRLLCPLRFFPKMPSVLLFGGREGAGAVRTMWGWGGAAGGCPHVGISPPLPPLVPPLAGARCPFLLGGGGGGGMVNGYCCGDSRRGRCRRCRG